MQSESTLNLWVIFISSPVIYTVLILMFIAAISIWLYSILTLKLSDMMPQKFIHEVRELLIAKHYEKALNTCQTDNNFTANIIARGITARKHGPQVMIEVMQSEGRRCGNTLWERIFLLNEIAVVAPFLGLLGTVLGLFFTVEKTSLSSEAIPSILNDLSIAIGTTIIGLIVFIFSMTFYATLKWRIISLLNTIETESLALVRAIDIDYQ